jgi:ubiquinone/menaquinone biosynthesis C-methylase UbiE
MEPRIGNEQVFHDRQARERAATFERQPEQLAVDEAAYLDHETWIRPAFQRLGDVRGLRVLDFGCGHGMAAVVLARRGAHVTAFDLSHGYLDEARRRAQANGVTIACVHADGHRLPFADGSFERVWGNAILHHLDLDVAGAELRRVLRPGGLAVFCEPWGENRLLRLARRRLAYPGKERTSDEQPLRNAHLRVLRRHFPRLEVQGFQLVSMVRRVLPRGRLVAGLDWCDDLLLKRVPALQNYCRYVVLTLPA